MSSLDRARDAKAELDSEVAAAAVSLEAAEVARREAEDLAERSERHLANLLRSVADRREGVARLAGDVAARRSRVEAAEAEIGRLRESKDAALKRAHEATTEFQHLETTVASVEDGEEDLDTAHEAATAEWDAAKAALDTLKEAVHTATRERDTHAARAEALELSLARKDGAGELLASGSTAVRGTVAALIEVEADAEDAIAAALGPLADALAVDSVEQAVDAIRWLRDEDAGRARFLVADAAARADNPQASLPAGAAWASDLVSGAGGIVDTVRSLVSGVAVVDDLAAARALVTAVPEVTAVTRRGDVLGARSAFGGAGDAPSVLHMQAALDEARAKRDVAAAEVERTTFALREAEERASQARVRHESTLERLNESDARMAAVAEQARAPRRDRARGEGRFRAPRRSDRRCAGADGSPGSRARVARGAPRGRTGRARTDRVGYRRGSDAAGRGCAGRRGGARQGDRVAPATADVRGTRQGASGTCRVARTRSDRRA
ncbi:hypothetical protein GCM10025876_32030 [Demequina litorisediminis]|uniref:SMC hinge domain-containing protein n=1 Tax=Demequina litorisediminis TaxID=1849022 RepID=A0ABQ6IGK2_9MICO|nr:hypothetical protein GCM10025876_32030 [Demequina litorisediminis]